MIKILKTKNGVSIVEVVVTSVIFTITTFGIMTTLALFRPLSEESIRRLEAAHVAQIALEGFRTEVDNSSWDANRLAAGTYSFFVNTAAGSFAIDYEVIDNPALGNIRQVLLNVTY